MVSRNTTPPHILTLVLVASLGPLSMNVFLPSLPDITRHFGVDIATGQFAVSSFLAAVAVMQLVLGPLSDKFGRRPVLQLSFLIAIIGTLICIHAPSYEIFILGRITQAAASAGIVLSRAVARDLTEGSKTAIMIAYITMGMSLTPMLAPVIGGLLDEAFGWQASFYLTLGFASFALLAVQFDLGETNQSKQNSIMQQIASYPTLLKSQRFWGYTAVVLFSSAGFFAFLGGGPLIANLVYGLSPAEYGFYFMFIALGYMIGNFISSQSTETVGMIKMMLYGNLVALTGLLAPLITLMIGWNHPFFFFGFIFFLGMGNGICLPSANSGVVNETKELAGSASGLSGSIQLGGGAIFAMFAGFLISKSSTIAPMTLLMCGCLVCAVLSTLYIKGRTEQNLS